MALQSFAIFPKDIIRLIAKMLSYQICGCCGAKSKEEPQHFYCRVRHIAGLRMFEPLLVREKRAVLMVERENAEWKLAQYSGTVAEHELRKLIDTIDSALSELPLLNDL